MRKRSNWDSPFEDGKLYNWNYRKGWDNYFEQKGFKKHGGSLIHHDAGHSGKGPRGYQRNDKAIYEDVCETLSLSPDVDARGIEVQVKEGCVFLRGDVPDRFTKKIAEFEIENISGVKDVQNLLDFEATDSDLH